MKRFLKDIPEIFSELHPTKNDLNLCENLTRASGKKVWWICSAKKHEYEARVDHRTLSGSGCPYCAGRYATEVNNLREKYPILAESICYALSPDADPTKIAPNSHKKLWWRCLKNDHHIFEAKVYSRIKKEDSCPYCSGYKVDATNSLQSLYPDLCEEWDVEKNLPLKPHKITSGTRRKVWWNCPNGHSYKSSVVQRTKKNSGCPHCSTQTSKPEIRILTELMSIFSTVESRFKIKKKEVDVYIPEFNVGIEFDGAYFHGNKKESDLAKNKALKKIGIVLIRVRVKPLTKIGEYDLLVENDDLNKSDLDQLMSKLKEHVDTTHLRKINDYISNANFMNEELFKTYLSYFPSPFPEHSLEENFPDMASEWHPQKNDPLLPKNFTAFSGQNIWWRCPVGHEYDMPIKNRTSLGINCPYCAGKRVDASNSISSLYPELTKQLNDELNHPLTGDDISTGSGKKVWWTCENGHNFKSRVADRVSKNRGCPYCSGRKASAENNLIKLYPWVQNIWDPKKNDGSTPADFAPKSKKKVWLKCKNGHSYSKKVQNIKNKENCPYCLKIIPSEDYNLHCIHPKIAERWCSVKNDITAKEILPSSGQKVWWRCPSGHQYLRAVYVEVKSGRCPICKT
jgi:hypothetical protein